MVNHIEKCSYHMAAFVLYLNLHCGCTGEDKLLKKKPLLSVFPGQGRVSCSIQTQLVTLNIFVRCLVILLRQTCCCRLDSHAFNASKSPRILCGRCSLSPACCSFVAASLRLATTVPPNTAVRYLGCVEVGV